MKFCKTCNTNKKNKYFYTTNNSKCKECISEYNRNYSKGVTTVTNDAGYIYVITNPAWEGYYKIGLTVNLSKRLSTYQTASPLRNYSFLTTKKVSDMHLAEKRVLDELKKYYDVKGEWVVASKAEHIIHLVEGLDYE
jgi:hypothetical protein